ncbi:MAG: hypothetical protein ACR2NM_02770 [Bythopirellula sp.]
MNLKCTKSRLAGACCLSLTIAWQSMAASQIEQPSSVDASLTESTEVAEQDAAVTPAGCCDGGTGCQGGSCGNNGCCGSGCCEPVCCPKKVTEEVKKHCWKVQPEMICIPGFRFECNWGKHKSCQSNGCCGDSCCSDTCCGDSCCGERCGCKDPGTPTCGRVRCVNVLEKHEYTCEECGYEWEVKCIRTGKGCCPCGNGCCPSCGASGCCAAHDTAAADVQLTSAAEATPAHRKQAEQPSLTSRVMGWFK